MLRKKSRLLVLLLIFGLLLAGCGGNSGEADGASQGEAKKSYPPITVVTAPMGSGWHSVSILMGDIWMNNMPGLNVSVLEGGSVGNIKAISQGLDANLGWAYLPDLKDAYKGVGVFDKPYTDCLAIGMMYPVWLNVITLEDSKIQSMADLKNARINAGAIGTGSEIAVQRLLAEYGLDYETIKKNGGVVSFGNYADAAAQLQDGIVDVMLGGGAPEIPAVREIEIQKPVRLIPADQKELESLLAKDYGYTIDFPIPAGTYQGQDEDVPAVAYQSLMIVNRDVPEDVVYELTKYIWENIDRIRQEQPARGNYMILEKALQGLEESQVHPGALKYYKEVGIY